MSAGIDLETNLDVTEMVMVCGLCNSAMVAMEGVCETCQVPLHISTKIASVANATLFLPIIGVQGVGKTTYMAMLLEMLRHGSYNIVADLGFRGTRAMQRETMRGLFDRRFPAPTVHSPTEWDWALTRLDIFDDRPKKSRGPISLLRREDDSPRLAARYEWCAPDWSGAAIERSIRNPGSVPSVTGNLARARGVILLLDATRISDDAQGEHQDLLAAHLAALVRQNAVARHPEMELHEIPLAIVFTKTDRCPVASAMPMHFAQRFMPQLCNFVHSHFANYKFFAVSVAGGVTRVQGDHFVPFHIQPQGVVDPFAWALYAQIYTQ